MQTKLRVFCDRFIEAGWLLAIILAPLYFDVYTNRVFEPDKIILVRSIALFMSMAWLIKALDTHVLSTRAARPAEQSQPAPLLKRITQQNILAWPTLALVVVYIISTLASVAPAITLWGSYQRLQGTYSTFSYIVIFFLAAGMISRREQIERILSVVIVTSLPIAVYGIVEHLKLEFLPWGGDVTVRVTSTMGNPIFIAAYLIMTMPIALARFLERVAAYMDAASEGDASPTRNVMRWLWFFLPAAMGVAVTMIIYLFLRLFGDVIQGQATSIAGVLVMFLMIVLCAVLAYVGRKHLVVYLGASFYMTVVLLEAAAIIFSGSRGPWIGWGVGLALFALLYTMKRNLRLLWSLAWGLGILVILFVAVVNMNNSPLAWARDIPYVGRLGSVLDEQGTAKVRSLIWQGAIQLIGVHTPIETPEKGPDALNDIRPLIGYGPDAMYVAYNRFYPPDLAHYEARNASPDRSHNETFDSLVMTGILGYFAYWLLFYTVIFIGLVYLKVIDGRHGRFLYLALMAAGVIALLILYSNVLPIKFAVGPPLLGGAVLAFYLFVAGISFYAWKGKASPFDLALIGLVAAIVAHFVEIQFGIAITSTRTHFWLYAALLVVIGRMQLVQAEAAAAKAAAAAVPVPVAPAPAERPIAAAAPQARPVTASVGGKKKKTVAAGRPRQDGRGAQRPAAGPSPAGASVQSLLGRALPGALPLSVVGGVILTTLFYNFKLPENGGTTPAATSAMAIPLYMIALLACVAVVALDGVYSGRDETDQRIAAAVVCIACSVMMWVGYVVFRAFVRLLRGPQVDAISLVAGFYIVLLVYGLLLAISLYNERKAVAGVTWSGPAAGLVYAGLAAATLFFVVTTNVSGILADVHYKTGLAYDNAQSYAGSVDSYQKAINLAPGQDFYYLFLGRSYMELARQFPERTATPAYDVATESPLTLKRERLAQLGREDLIRASQVVLEKARDLNPLNTDHYANLGRLNRFWAEAGNTAKLADADKYFQQAISLSPNNADLWDQWAVVTLMKGDVVDADAKIRHSLELDSQYDLTYYYLGNLLMSQGENNQDEAQRLDILKKAADAYGSCIKYAPTNWECYKARGYIAGKYLGDSQGAVADFTTVLNKGLPKVEDVNKISNATEKQRVVSELINMHQNLAVTYMQMGQYEQALSHAQTAAQLSPNDQALKNLIEQLKLQLQK